MYQAVIIKFPKSIGQNCVSDSTDTTIYIEEKADKRCHLVTDKNTAHFTIKNKDSQIIHFLAIDNCLLSSSDKQKRCDCAVFNDNTFCFIEIKRKKGKIGETLREARAQIKQSIIFFKKEFTELKKYRLEAFASLGKGTIDPSFNASLVNTIVAFEEQTGAVLYIDDQKEFENTTF